jgi:hypothetical protein
MTALNNFNAIAPEFSDILDTGEIQTYLNIASTQLTNSSWSTSQKDLLIAYLAAHIATIALKKKGVSGSVDSISEGNLSMSYNSFNAKDNYDTTTYGREYKSKLRSFTHYIQKHICV